MRKLLHKVKGWITGAPSKGGHSAMVYVYSSGKDGDINPNDQINILRRLSSFTEKELIPVTVIFAGRPSRKIPDGTKQGMVEVRYATGDQMIAVVAKAVTAAKRTHSVVLAVNRPELEKWAHSNRVKHIRATTFEKSLDAICGPLRRDQPQQPQQQRQQPQGQQPSRQPQAQPQEQPQEQQPLQQSDETDRGPATDGEQRTDEPPTDPTPQPTPAPAPRQEPSRKLHRHDPHAKKEERDQAILDLIDPL